MSDPVCVNAHDRCYEGGPCPLCEPAPSWQQKMKDTIATLTAERDALAKSLNEAQDEVDQHEGECEEACARAARLEEALRDAAKRLLGAGMLGGPEDPVVAALAQEAQG
jgi:hypothetical protein